MTNEEEDNDGFSEWIPYPVSKQKEIWRDEYIDSHIHGNVWFKILRMLEAYSDILTEISSSTNTTQHGITLTDNKPIAVHQSFWHNFHFQLYIHTCHI